VSRGLTGVTLTLVLAVCLLAPRTDAVQPPGANPPSAHLAGLQWTFVRVKYSAQLTRNYRFDYWGEPWAIDAPAAEQNLSRRPRTRHSGSTRGSTSSSQATSG
jgi:hypothetical protein